MKKMLLLATTLGVLLAATSPAPAALQVDGTEYPPPDFVLNEDGTLLQGGDILHDCPGAFRDLEQYRDVDPGDPSVPFELRQHLSQSAASARLCEQNGFEPSAGEGEPVVTYANPPGSDAPGPPCLEEDCIPPPPGAVEYGAETLPDTGGVALLPLAGSSLVAGGLLLVIRRPCTRRGLAGGPADAAAVPAR